MKKLHPNALWLYFLQYAGGLISFYIIFAICGLPSMLSSVVAISGRNSGTPLLIILAIAVCSIIPFLALAYVFARLSYNNYMYELREDGFYYEKGVISKKYVTIPYERIQNVDIYRGLVARILGLSDLQIQTAGMSTMMTYRGGMYGAGSEGRLPGLDPQDALQIRDEVLKRAKGAKSGV